jgi:hypothetical protein
MGLAGTGTDLNYTIHMDSGSASVQLTTITRDLFVTGCGSCTGKRFANSTVSAVCGIGIRSSLWDRGINNDWIPRNAEELGYCRESLRDVSASRLPPPRVRPIFYSQKSLALGFKRVTKTQFACWHYISIFWPLLIGVLVRAVRSLIVPLAGCLQVPRLVAAARRRPRH